MSPRTPPTFPPDAGLGRLDYSQAPAAVYFVAATGDRWRVHDCVMEGGRLVRLGSPDNPRAAYRVFVAETGVRKLYTRLKGEVWRLTPAQCDRQLTAAEFLGQTPDFNAADRSAT